MLMRVAIFASLAVVAATQVPRLIETLDRPASPPPPQTLSVAPTAPTPSAGYGQAVIDADERGHFVANFRLNGKTVEAMVDTGASSVAINESTARRLGFTAATLDFKYRVNTANGQTDAAAVTLDRVELGSLRVTDVKALVLRDNALSGTLIGMSFLGKLGSYKAEGGRLKLAQK
ncbi:TIGR02281 family clan AA aspartic protease [Allorhizobium undicola]|uniref:TIGR02281 family clan AA aspartic protease n=1 Tax=Allorhizobium undicola TaxID=78527 RepID=UPI003D328EAF